MMRQHITKSRRASVPVRRGRRAAAVARPEARHADQPLDVSLLIAVTSTRVALEKNRVGLRMTSGPAGTPFACECQSFQCHLHGDVCAAAEGAHRVRLPAGAQSCCWFCGRRMALDRRKSRQRAPSQRGRSMTAPSTSELRISAPQLKREWSLWPELGWNPGNLRGLSKG
jgi:hypothetical protein